MGFDTARGLYHASRLHQVSLVGACGSWSNFDQCLAAGLNLAAESKITHMAMLHADVSPEEWWLDKLLAELDRVGGDLISVAVPIKDPRGVTSSGIGNPHDTWHPLKRFTMEELYRLPETFAADDVGFAGYPLLHNHGCYVCDLRRPVFSQTDADGVLIANFDFRRRLRKGDDGLFIAEGESEDWYWSRRMAEIGVRSFVTRKVALQHEGNFSFPNTGPWGMYDDGDRDTKANWAPEAAKTLDNDPTIQAINTELARLDRKEQEAA